MQREGMDKVAGYEEALRSATGASEDMAETMNDNLSGDMANMNSAYEEMQLQTFEYLNVDTRQGSIYWDASMGSIIRTSTFLEQLKMVKESISIFTCTGDVLDEK